MSSRYFSGNLLMLIKNFRVTGYGLLLTVYTHKKRTSPSVSSNTPHSYIQVITHTPLLQPGHNTPHSYSQVITYTSQLQPGHDSCPTAKSRSRLIPYSYSQAMPGAPQGQPPYSIHQHQAILTASAPISLPLNDKLPTGMPTTASC